MTTVLTPSRGLSKQGTGDNVGSWDILNNGNFDLIDSALGGAVQIALSNANVTLTSAQAANLRIAFTGTLTANVTVTIPSGVSGLLVLRNATSGNYSLTVASATTGGTITQTLPQGYSRIVVVTGGNVLAAYDTNPVIAGQCRLSLNGSALLLAPFNGNCLTINGVVQTIPPTGVTMAATGLSPNTLYYIYALMNSGSPMALEASTTGYTQAASGLMVKNGEASRTLVGMVYNVNSSGFVSNDVNDCVRSWFNRKPTRVAGVTGNLYTSSTTATPISAALCGILMWADECISLAMFGQASSNGNVLFSTYFSVNGNIYADGQTGDTRNGITMTFAVSDRILASEGYKQFAVMGRSSDSAVTVSWSSVKIVASIG